MVNGPWSVLFKAAAKATGKKMGQQVARDVRIAEKSNKVTISNEDYKELAEIKGVSSEWLQGLISRSRNPDQITKVAQYMTDHEKTANLGVPVKKVLFKKLLTKINDMDSQAISKFTEHQEKVKKVWSILEDFIT